MRTLLFLKYEQSVDLGGTKLTCTRKHLISRTPSKIGGYGGYGWVISAWGNFKYTLYFKDKVFDYGTFRNTIVLFPNGGKDEDYSVSIERIDIKKTI